MGKEDLTCLSVLEFAKTMSVGSAFIRRLCKVDGFPSMRIGRKNIIYKEKAIEWMMAHKDELSKV